MLQKIIVIAGPTAIGKTALGIRLAQAFNGEIINGDSQQVYRDVHIGTAKPSLDELASVPHHLIDIRDVTAGFSAADFVQLAKIAIQDILSRGKLPIIVGGTGLYLQSLLEGYHLGGSGRHEDMQAYRQVLENLDDASLERLSADLEITQANRRRRIRALELARFGQDMVNRPTPYQPLMLGLDCDRQKRYDRINARVEEMMAAGLEGEASWLYQTYPEAQVCKAIGYKELFPYFEGTCTLAQAVDQIKQNTRRYSKRQMTWFKNRMQIPFYDVLDPHYPQIVLDKVEEFIAR